MRRTSGTLVGDGGGTGGPGGDAPSSDVVRKNDATGDASGAAPRDFASVRATPGPAASMTCPSAQQSLQVALRRTADDSGDDALCAVASSGTFDRGEP